MAYNNKHLLTSIFKFGQCSVKTACLCSMWCQLGRFSVEALPQDGSLMRLVASARPSNCGSGDGRAGGLNFFRAGRSRWLFGLCHYMEAGFQKLPEYFNAWAQKSQNVISSILYWSKQKQAQSRLKGRADKLQLSMEGMVRIYRMVKLFEAMFEN